MEQTAWFQNLNAIAGTLFSNKQYAQASVLMHLLYNLGPEPGVCFNLARCYFRLNLPDRAELLMRQALHSDPNWEDAKLELSLYLAWQGRTLECENILNQMPNNPRARFNLGWHKISQGHFHQGLQFLDEGRFQGVWGLPRSHFSKPRWDGKNSLKSKTVLLVGEGGQGDEIIALRTVKHFASLGAKVIVAVSKGLVPIASRVDGVLKAIELPGSLDGIDEWIPMMSAAYLLGLSEPGNHPYLTPDLNYVEKWKKKLVNYPGLKVALRWQGNPDFEQDQMRTLPIQELHDKLVSISKTIPKEIHFFSVQKDAGKENCPQSLIDLSADLESWEDTAAVLSLMDLVITSCTSVAHLAGALGIKTFVISPVVPYFTWSKPVKKSDWYLDVNVYKQKKMSDWQEPILEACEDFQSFLQTKESS